MVSKASEDLPEPDNPVSTVSVSRGISTSTFLRLCSRAPRMEMFFSIGLSVLWLGLEGALGPNRHSGWQAPCPQPRTCDDPRKFAGASAGWDQMVMQPAN